MENKRVANLVLVELPRKTSYFVGAKNLDRSGGTVCIVYDDGSYEQRPMDNGMDAEFDFGQEGPALVKLKYGGQETLFQVQVQQPQVRRFVVKKPPAKTRYLAGEKLDLTGLVLFAEYETGEKEPWPNLPEVNYTVKDGDAVYPLTISGITIPIYIKVSPAKLVGIRMGKLPDKTEYLERAEAFDPSGGTIIQAFDSGAEKEISLTMNSVRGFSNLVTGEQTLTVQVGPMTTTFQVMIRPKQATRLQVISSPAKVNYIEGQEISMEGLRLSAEYDNGETHVIEEFGWEPKTADLNTMCVLVSADGASVEIPVGVSPRQITGIYVERLPDKVKYLEKKETLNAEGGQLRLEYNFGGPNIIPISSEMVHGFDNRQAGECKVEVQYQGFTATFSVEITPQQLIGILVTTPPSKTTYAPGEKFDPAGMTVSGFYNNGLLQPITSYAIMPDRPLEKQDVAVIIGNMDKSAVVAISVDEKFRETEPEIHIEEFLAQIAPEPEAAPEPKPEPEPEPKGLRRFFYPSAARLRGLHDD